jgi:hypothetical protein
MGKTKLAQLLDSEDEDEGGGTVVIRNALGRGEEEQEGNGKQGEEAMRAANVGVRSVGIGEEQKGKEKERGEEGGQDGGGNAEDEEEKREEEEEGDDDGDDEEEEEEEEQPASEPKPLGDVIKRGGRGKLEKLYFQAFELDGNRYELVRNSSYHRKQSPFKSVK